MKSRAASCDFAAVSFLFGGYGHGAAMPLLLLARIFRQSHEHFFQRGALPR
jgi:hypothetical protein